MSRRELLTLLSIFAAGLLIAVIAAVFGVGGGGGCDEVTDRGGIHQVGNCP